jgi:hypothetical protein
MVPGLIILEPEPRASYPRHLLLVREKLIQPLPTCHLPPAKVTRSRLKLAPMWNYPTRYATMVTADSSRVC